MPLFGGKKTLWNVKELSKYERQFDGSEIPPIYDMEKVTELQRQIDTLIRPNWDYIHPALQDFIAAWNESWNQLVREKETIDSELRQKNTLLSNMKANFESKLRELNNSIQSLKDDLQAKENELTQKGQFIKDLEAADKENKLGISDLRAKLESRLNQLNQEMSQHQQSYEKTQMQVGHAFQQKVLELDSEMLSLNEQLSEKEKLIKDQGEKITTLQKQNQKLQIYESKTKEYESKIQKYEGKLNQIAEILELENEKSEE